MILIFKKQKIPIIIIKLFKNKIECSVEKLKLCPA